MIIELQGDGVRKCIDLDKYNITGINWDQKSDGINIVIKCEHGEEFFHCDTQEDAEKFYNTIRDYMELNTLFKFETKDTLL